MPSLTPAYRQALEAQGRAYCHSCDEIYVPLTSLYQVIERIARTSHAEITRAMIDELYTTAQATLQDWVHEDHELARAEKRLQAGLEPFGEGFERASDA